jgi:hypothetical protein
MWHRLLGTLLRSEDVGHLQVLSELLKHWQSLRMAIAAAAAMSVAVVRHLLQERFLPLSPWQLQPLQPSTRLLAVALPPFLLATPQSPQQHSRRHLRKLHPPRLPPAPMEKPRTPLQYWACSMSHVKTRTRTPQVVEDQQQRQQVGAVTT